MTKVLVPLDGSELADGILKHVEVLLGQEPCDVVLLRVLTPRDLQEEVPGQADLARGAARTHLDTVKGRLAEVGARVTTVVREGDPAEEIIKATEEGAPDLVAMSSHGRSGVMRWIRGSVAERVLRNSPAPLLLVTSHALEQGPEATNISQRFRRILVPLDGSARSARVLPLVTRLAKTHGAEVVLCRIEWEGLNRPMLAAALAPEKIAESLRPWREQLEKEGLLVLTLAAQGDAASEILDLAEREGCDLVAMATHGRSGLSRLVEGSVAEKVLRHCRRPLLVVPVHDPD
jgi:nucleotide-binding universal stress UspA family protein